MIVKSLIIPRDIEEKLYTKHKATRSEVEEIFDSTPQFRFAERGHVEGENLSRAIGQTEAGRYLAIFFIMKKSRVALVISARDLTDSERKQYGKK